MTMKYIYLITLTLLHLSCSVIKNKTIDDQKHNTLIPGKCVYAVVSAEHPEWRPRPSMIIEISPPTFKKVKKKYTLIELKKSNTSVDVAILIRAPHVQYQFLKPEMYTEFMGDKVGYSYCLVDNNGLYKHLRLDTIRTEIIEIEHFIFHKASNIKYIEVDHCPIHLKPNQVCVRAGNMSPEREVAY
jgi:hypothetical protein